MRTAFLVLCSIAIASAQPQFVSAWNADGHKTVGAIADKLITGTHAGTEVHSILGTMTLQQAAVWPDCARGVNETTLKYSMKKDTNGKPAFPECTPFETNAGKATMEDFVSRNLDQCHPKPGEETCHKGYHYADISVGRDHYDPTFVGARDSDVVHAIVAATHVLKGDPCPPPFSFKDKREALLVLTHYVGDIHQPLHVGAVYLDQNGNRVDPDPSTFDPKTATKGGNFIDVQGSSRNIHKTWDAIPTNLTATHITSDGLLTAAKAVPASAGSTDDWPTTWASETVQQAREAFNSVKFSSAHNGRWTATVPANYSTVQRPIKKTQLARGGARLAQLLEAIWP